MTSMKTVSTPQGEVKLLPPSVEILDRIQALLPFSMARYIPAHEGADYGFVIKHGESELFCVKQQPVDCDEQQSTVTKQANSILIADSLVNYLTHGFAGLFMPFTYIRTKDAGRFESGIAYFGSPSQQGPECKDNTLKGAFDAPFGSGFTTMMGAFIRALQQSSRNTGITLSPTIGLDVRTWFQIGSFSFSYMIVGPHVVCLKAVISERDPTWTVLKSTGISEVFHIPSMAAVLRVSASTN
jgi:hypothetical protein